MNEEPEILIDLRDGVAEVTLNRPRSLNALTLGMVRVLNPQLKKFAADNTVRYIVVRGAGEKAFCAGGDVQKLYEGGPGSRIAQDFFREEYQLNRRIHFFPKPFVAIMDGITMGGGVGLSVHAGTRIAANNTMFAMPETGIGLFPDVGGSWFLPRLPGEIGMYMAMTGARLKAADCVYAGICDAYVPNCHHDDLIKALRGGIDINATLKEFSRAPGPSPLAANREAIDRCFAGDSVEMIEQRLAGDGSEWAQKQLSIMAGKSPSSQKITFRQLRNGVNLEFDDCMIMEYRMAQRAMEGGDFFEGVRAVVADKDMAPKWNPAKLSEFSEQDVEKYFLPLDDGDLTFPE